MLTYLVEARDHSDFPRRIYVEAIDHREAERIALKQRSLSRIIHVSLSDGAVGGYHGAALP